MAVRILPPASAEQLLGDSWAGPPEPGSRDELRTARKLSEAITARIDAAVAELYPNTVDPSGRERRWTWLARLFR